MTGSPQQRLEARVVGRVQAVGFRWWVVDQATALGLVGWVRNGTDDRSVELVAEGSAEAVATFEDRLRRGPPASRVDELDARRQVARGGMTGFQIRRG